jgi:hypothetical protein
MAQAIRDCPRVEVIAADIAGYSDAALDLLSVNAYDIAIVDRDIPGPTGDEIAKRIVASVELVEDEQAAWSSHGVSHRSAHIVEDSRSASSDASATRPTRRARASSRVSSK